MFIVSLNHRRLQSNLTKSNLDAISICHFMVGYNCYYEEPKNIPIGFQNERVKKHKITWSFKMSNGDRHPSTPFWAGVDLMNTWIEGFGRWWGRNTRERWCRRLCYSSIPLTPFSKDRKVGVTKLVWMLLVFPNPSLPLPLLTNRKRKPLPSPLTRSPTIPSPRKSPPPPPLPPHWPNLWHPPPATLQEPVGPLASAVGDPPSTTGRHGSGSGTRSALRRRRSNGGPESPAVARRRWCRRRSCSRRRQRWGGWRWKRDSARVV